jgi:3',5'-cyclic AMP phosphodiesterase CpdA
MRKLIHLSDLHFGSIDFRLIEPLISSIKQIRPDLIAVSGDLTQRARKEQFQQARNFLDALAFPQIIVPGNHDVPLYNLYGRFIERLERYRCYITKDLEPFYSDPEMAVLGVNTARSLTFKGGRINEEQVAKIQERLCPFSDEITKIIVTHHPFDLPESYHDRELVGRARMAMERLANCGVDLFLAGHLHVSLMGQTTLRFKIRGHSALVVQAGTAISTRMRGECNSFNLIQINHPDIVIQQLKWEPDRGAFFPSVTDFFHHTLTGWVRAPQETTASTGLTEFC